MKLFLGFDGYDKVDTRNDDVYLLELGTFILFGEQFNSEIIDCIMNLKGQYDLILYRNYEVNLPISTEKLNVIKKLRTNIKSKIEQSVCLLISETVKKF